MTTRAIQIESLLDPVIDPNTGAVASGYTVYFYAAGTTTAKNVWTEKEKTNPFTSKTLGSDGTIQLYGDGLYKIVIKDGDGDTVHEWDNLKIKANNFSIVQKSATYTVTPDDDVVLVDTDGGNITINLQTVANFEFPVVIKNIGSNQVTIDPYSTQTIDGASTLTLSSNGHTTLYPDNESGLWHRTVAITVLEDSDGDTKIQAEETEDEDLIRFDIGGTEQMVLDDGVLYPTTDNDVDLGKSSKQFKYAYVVNADVSATLRLLDNNHYVLMKNAAGSGYVNMLKVNASDDLETGAANFIAATIKTDTIIGNSVAATLDIAGISIEGSQIASTDVVPSAAMVDATAGTYMEYDSQEYSNIAFSGTFTKYIEARVPRGGTITTRLYMNRDTADNNADMRGRIYVNGAAVGTIRTISAPGNDTWDENITVDAGDLVQVYGDKDDSDPVQGDLRLKIGTGNPFVILADNWATY